MIYEHPCNNLFILLESTVLLDSVVYRFCIRIIVWVSLATYAKIVKIVSDHNHTMQTNPQHREEVTVTRHLEDN